MLIHLYRKFIGRSIFRKQNLGIGLSLLCVFILIGSLTYNSFYLLLEQREQELLSIRTEKLELHLVDMIERFKRETVSLYKDKVNGQPIGTNEYFLPGNVPDAEDERMQLYEKNYFTGTISMMLNRNPSASAFVFYRLQDRKIFYQTRQQQMQLNDSFNFAALSASFPRDYTYPYIGKADGILDSLRPVIYFANPVFDLARIHPDKVYGYYVMIIDAESMADAFYSSQDSESRLIINANGELLLDTNQKGFKDDLNTQQNLLHRINLEQYGIEITGVKSKTAIQSKLSEITLSIVLILGLAWPICLLLIFAIQKIVLKRLYLMMQHFKRVQTNPFTEPMPVQGNDEISDLIIRFNRMTEELQQYINRVYVIDIQKRNAEYVALKMQINPHFLFNTLESLRMQAVVNGQSILAEKLYNMGKLFRWMLKTDGEAIPVQEELQYVEYYLDLFNMGKSNTIRLEVHSELDLNDCYMLKFSLQPIVENAILHGELEKRNNPAITLQIMKQDEQLWIEIYNNGNKITQDKMLELIAKLDSPNYLPEEHLGLKNIHERIRNYFGEQYGLVISKENSQSTDGFCIHMKLPFELHKGR
jgi:two-component system sensor histidine kinase YesM